MMKNTTGVPYGNNKATGKYYNIRGFKMYCEVYGKGQPVLIIHGNGGSINNFVQQIPYFSKKYKVIEKPQCRLVHQPKIIKNS